ncbi:hypothetical protein FOA52_011239 [Chlamydomonas sp. UWO 241]|nr:hypothetical protein FOA52_011239 [Chlamydomonas sp. UWO 241]
MGWKSFTGRGTNGASTSTTGTGPITAAARAFGAMTGQDGPDLDPGEATARARDQRVRAMHDTLLAHQGRPLNAEQRAAVDAPKNTPLLIVAGAGTGKTTTLLARVRALILQGVNPAHILVITFTTKAAEELRTRLLQDMGLPKGTVCASTFHTWCLKVLWQYYEEAGFERRPVVWNDAKEAVALAIRRAELDAAASQAGKWLGLPDEGSGWHAIMAVVKERHPEVHNQAAHYALNQASEKKKSLAKRKEKEAEEGGEGGRGGALRAGPGLPPQQPQPPAAHGGFMRASELPQSASGGLGGSGASGGCGGDGGGGGSGHRPTASELPGPSGSGGGGRWAPTNGATGAGTGPAHSDVASGSHQHPQPFYAASGSHLPSLHAAASACGPAVSSSGGAHLLVGAKRRLAAGPDGADWSHTIDLTSGGVWETSSRPTTGSAAAAAAGSAGARKAAKTATAAAAAAGPGSERKAAVFNMGAWARQGSQAQASRQPQQEQQQQQQQQQQQTSQQQQQQPPPPQQQPGQTSQQQPPQQQASQQQQQQLAGRSRSHQIPPAMRDVSGALHSGPDGVLKAMTESFDKLYGGETKLSDETLNQLENDVVAFELTRATEVDEAHGRPPDLAETEACVRALRSAAAPGGDQLDAMLLRLMVS